MVPKMMLRLGFVDLVYHTASSILARLVTLSELSEPSGRAHLEFSFTPLSQCKLQAVCCRERLHVTESGIIAILSLQRAPNWFHKLAVNTSPTALTVQSLVFAVAIPREGPEVFRQVRGLHMFAADHIGHLHAVGANTMD